MRNGKANGILDLRHAVVVLLKRPQPTAFPCQAKGGMGAAGLFFGGGQFDV